MVKKEKIIFPRQHCKEKNVEFITSSQPVLPRPSGHPCTKLWPIIPVQDNFWSWQVSQSFCLFILVNIFFYSCSRFDFWRWSQKQMQICYPDWSVWASCQKHTIKLPTSFPNRTDRPPHTDLSPSGERCTPLPDWLSCSASIPPT